MSDIATVTSTPRRPKSRPDITIDGEVWSARSSIAAVIDITDRAAQRMNWRTVYIGGIAYCPKEESLRDTVARARRRYEPTKRRGK